MSEPKKARVANEAQLVDLLVTNIPALYTINPELEGCEGQLGLIRDASVAFKGDKVVFIGDSNYAIKNFEPESTLDGSGMIGLPGLVDCHTHSVWAGSRADEFARRLAGESYVSILEKGGGIRSTVTATRAASIEELTESCRLRLKNMRDSHGVTTVEVKSGYGLNTETELKMLKAAKAASAGIVRSIRTFLGAHVIPAEYKDKREEYVSDIINNQLPACRPYADCVDVFCDRGAFTVDEARAILTAGKEAGLVVRAHAEQIESTGCAKLVAELGGSSADHLEHLDEEGVKAMADHGVVAVLLPGAQLYLKDDPPPVSILRDANVKLAVATDLNPGSSPVHSLWVSATLSCILQGLTVEQAVLGITRNAGLALGRKDLGWLDPKGNSVADLVLFKPPPGESPNVESMVNQMGAHKVKHIIIDGKLVSN